MHVREKYHCSILHNISPRTNDVFFFSHIFVSDIVVEHTRPIDNTEYHHFGIGFFIRRNKKCKASAHTTYNIITIFHHYYYYCYHLDGCL